MPPRKRKATDEPLGAQERSRKPRADAGGVDRALIDAIVMEFEKKQEKFAEKLTKKLTKKFTEEFKEEMKKEFERRHADVAAMARSAVSLSKITGSDLNDLVAGAGIVSSRPEDVKCALTRAEVQSFCRSHRGVDFNAKFVWDASAEHSATNKQNYAAFLQARSLRGLSVVDISALRNAYAVRCGGREFAGTSDVALCEDDIDDPDVALSSLLVAIELKKGAAEKRDHNQAMAELIVGSIVLRRRIVVLLTDLRSYFAFYWLEYAEPEHGRRASRSAAKKAVIKRMYLKDPATAYRALDDISAALTSSARATDAVPSIEGVAMAPMRPIAATQVSVPAVGQNTDVADLAAVMEDMDEDEAFEMRKLYAAQVIAQMPWARDVERVGPGALPPSGLAPLTPHFLSYIS